MGKNHLTDAAVKMMPKDWVSKITSLSSHSLRHAENEYRCVYLAERRGLGTTKETEADYDMKVSISEGYIKAWVAEKQPNGRIMTVEKTIKIGSFITTTTEIAPPPELANRIWNVSIDESLDHKKDVSYFILEQAELFDEEAAYMAAEAKREVLRCLFSKLDKETQGTKVIIPFATALNGTLPIQTQGLYRHIQKMVGLMKIVAKVWHRKCPRKGKYIIAIPDIYGETIKIGGDAIQAQFLNMTERQRIFWSKLKKELQNSVELTVSEAANKTGHVYSSTKDWIRFLEDLGLLNSRMEGREKYISLRKVEPVRVNSVDVATLTAKYKEWINENGVQIGKGAV